MEDMARRMAKAIERLGFFIFEVEELEKVREVLENAKLEESLKIVHLGDVDLELGNTKLSTSYYMISIDVGKCVERCEGKGKACLDNCIKEKKAGVARALLEAKPVSKKTDLSSLLQKLKSEKLQ